jgi:hypothetical protein
MLYITPDYKNIFFINLKVCYSSFGVLYKENKVLKLNIGWNDNRIDESMLDKIDPSVKLYIIMRCPYSRICSFYKNKFVDTFKKVPVNDGECQKEMYKYFCEKKIRNGEFTITDMINMIKLGYRNPHIKLQSDILSNYSFKKNINIIKLEDPEFNNILKSILGYDMPHANSSGGGKIDMLSPESKEFIYELYKADFDLYNK